MSKAFVKEPDVTNEVENDDIDPIPLPKGTKNYITPEGADRLKSELKQLLTKDRPELVRVIEWAASNGDRSENADYIYGKRRLREMDRRIRFLSKRLEAAEIVDPAKQKSDRVLFGATVTVLNEDGKQLVYQIVGVDEIDVSKRRVSWVSPIARALLNAKVQDVVTLRTPKGEEELEVVRIEYK